MYLVLEYCDGGDLDKFLLKHGRLPVATAKDFMRQLGMAVIWIRIFLGGNNLGLIRRYSVVLDA